MSLGFILGRAGSGKTTLCLRGALEAAVSRLTGPSAVLLVPEQATLRMEQALLDMAGTSALGRVLISGFRRLALGVLEEVAGPARPVTRLGCLMALVGILERRRAELTLLGPVAGQVGAAVRVAAALEELRAWGVGARELAALAGVLAREEPSRPRPPRLGLKLRDLALVARELEEWLAGRLLEPDGVLVAARRHLAESGLRGAAVWVDGFSDFTRPELEFLLELARVAEVRVALCLACEPAGEGGGIGSGPLAEVAATYRELAGGARRLGLRVEETVVLPGDPPLRFARSPALARLEAFLVGVGRPGTALAGDEAGSPPRTDAARPAVVSLGEGSRPAVRLAAAPDRRTEVEGAAREILRLVREEGLRFRDVGVLTRDVGLYADLVESVFPLFGIPFFIDRRRAAVHHPLVRLILAALAAVGDWSPRAVLGYLKNHLQPAAVDAVDRLEDAVRQRWLGGREDWLAPWPGLPPGLERVRRRLLRPLARFARRLGKGGRLPAARVGKALWLLLEELRLPRRLAALAEAAAAEGKTGEAADHLQVWEGVVGVLEEYVQHLGDTVLSLEQHVRVLEAALAGLDLATPPPAVDQVVVGAVDRSRFHGLEALVVLGAVEGEFPAVPQEEALLDDAERERLADLGFPVGPTLRRLQHREEYLAYIALTRATRHLWLSWPQVDGGGRRLSPSPLVERVRACLGGGEAVEKRLGRAPAPADCAAEPDVVEALLAGVRAAAEGGEPPAGWPALYEVARRRPALAAALREAVADVGPFGPGPWPTLPLPAPEVRVVSVTELEDMAACPFRRFLMHVVRARPAREARVDGRLLGELYHEVLAALGRAALERAGGFADLADADTERLLEEALARFLAGDGVPAGLAPPLRGLLVARSRRHLSSAAAALRAWARRSAFRPAAVEMEVRFPLPGREDWVVTGRLDRLDEAVVDGERLLLVVDYKRRGTSPGGAAAVREGRHLQLPLYCLAAAGSAAAGPAEPPPEGSPVVAGAILFPVEPAPGAARGGEGRSPHRARGWLLGERRVLVALDGAAGREESVLSVRWRRDGEAVATEYLLDRRRLAALLAEAAAVARSLAEAVAAGEVRRRPWRRGAGTACDACLYGPLCPFDPLLGDGYRLLAETAGSSAGPAGGTPSAPDSRGLEEEG